MERWQEQIKTSITRPIDLLTRLDLDPSLLPLDVSAEATKNFEFRVPESYVNRMTPGNPEDPLLLQVLPHGDELKRSLEFSSDPLQEHNLKIPGLMHKYFGRVLLIVRGSCAVHCRYCFRREFPYSQNSGGNSFLKPAIDYIKATKSIHEVILSGGDPLMSSDEQLGWLINQIENVEHVKTIRIHSRLPVVIPDRITDSLCSHFAKSRLNVNLVTHINHPNEIDSRLTSALHKLKPHVNFLLNQSVLLKKINNNASTLESLSHRLHESQVMPYYLNLLDLVNGTSHFLVHKREAEQIMQSLLQRLPGYLVPKLVKELPDKPYKVIQNYLS